MVGARSGVELILADRYVLADVKGTDDLRVIWQDIEEPTVVGSLFLGWRGYDTSSSDVELHLAVVLFNEVLYDFVVLIQW